MFNSEMATNVLPHEVCRCVWYIRFLNFALARAGAITPKTSLGKAFFIAVCWHQYIYYS